MRIDERTADAKAMDWDMLCIKHHGTVYLITDEEWDEISDSYNVYRNGLLLKGPTTCVTFAYWLKSLISLTGEGK